MRSVYQHHEMTSPVLSKLYEALNISSRQEHTSNTSTQTEKDTSDQTIPISTQQILETSIGLTDLHKSKKRTQTSTRLYSQKRNPEQISSIHTKYSRIPPFSPIPSSTIPNSGKTSSGSSRRKSILYLNHEFLPCIEYPMTTYVMTSEESINELPLAHSSSNNTKYQEQQEMISASETASQIPISNVQYICSSEQQDIPPPCSVSSSLRSNTNSITSKRTNSTYVQRELYPLKYDSTGSYTQRI